MASGFGSEARETPLTKTMLTPDPSSHLTISEANQADEKSRLELLKKAWSAEDATVFGVVERSQKSDGKPMWWLKTIHNRLGNPLEYPLEDLPSNRSLRNGAYILRRNVSDLSQLEGYHVRAQFRLAPSEEQKKKGNPLLVNITQVTLEVRLEESMLSRVPDGGGFTFSESLYEAIVTSNYPELAKSLDSLKAEEQRLNDEISNAKLEVERERDRISRAREDADAKVQMARSEAEERIAAVNNSIVAETQEIERVRSRKVDLENECREVQAGFDALRPKQDEIRNNANLYLRVGLLAPDEYRKICGLTTKAQNDAAFDNQVSGRVQRYLAKERKLLYPRYLLDEFLALLLTHDLILLTGASGVGKTSLVKGVAGALGGTPHIIPVKPNWISSDDLIGFLHPTSGGFHSGPLLDAFDEADADTSALHIICLDEMNLARIEYYFNDFISGLENRRNPQIALYSNGNAVTLDHDARASLENGGSKTSPRPRPLRSIPPNVRFLGCLNVDDTTQPLSPKLRDRAHVMRLSDSAMLFDPRIRSEIEVGGPSDPIRLDARSLPERTDYPDLDLENPICTGLARWSHEYLAALGVPVSARVLRQAMFYDLQFAKTTGLPSGSHLALNATLLHKVLPRFTFEGRQKLVSPPAENGRGKPKLRFSDTATRQEVLALFAQELRESIRLEAHPEYAVQPPNAAEEIDRLIRNAAIYDGLIDYWA